MKIKKTKIFAGNGMGKVLDNYYFFGYIKLKDFTNSGGGKRWLT
jgi:hypothetical protein